METVTDFIFLGSKVTADGDYSHNIKRLLLLGRKAMTNLESVLKSRDITLPTKVHIYVWMWKLDHKEGWAPRIDAFKFWCWRHSWEFTGQQGDQTSQAFRKSTMNIHWHDRCWSWSSNPLFFSSEQTLWKRPLCWEGLKARGAGCNRRWDVWMASSTQWTWVWANSGR